jgi:hypothetical protein
VDFTRLTHILVPLHLRFRIALALRNWRQLGDNDTFSIRIFTAFFLFLCFFSHAPSF